MTKSATNEGLLQVMQDLMQMTSEGFDKVDRQFEAVNGRLDGLDGRVDGLDGRIDKLEGEMKELKQASYRHELQLGELTKLAQNTNDKLTDLITVDIKEILTRLQALEDRLPNITEAEMRKLQLEMQLAIDWIARAAKTLKVPVKFPS